MRDTEVLLIGVLGGRRSLETGLRKHRDRPYGLKMLSEQLELQKYCISSVA